MLDFINSQYGHFDNFLDVKNNMSNFTLSPMIPNLNLILYEIFHEHLLSDTNELIVHI